MKAVRATLVTFAVLGGVWGTLGLIAWLAGVWPTSTGVDEARDAGVDASLPDAAPVARQPDAAVASPDAGAPPPPPSFDGHRVRVCPYPDSVDHNLDQSFAIGELLAGGPPEIVVGCADRFVVLGLVSGPAGVTVLRLGELIFEPTNTENARHTATAGIGDITGDDKADLLLPFYQRAERGGSRGGRLSLWRRIDQGFARPLPLGTQTFHDVAVADLDGRGGLDFVVVDRGRPWAEQPGSVRVFQGGTRPRERVELPAGKWARRVGIVDLDLDGTRDVVVHSDEVVHVHRRQDGFRFDAPLEIDARRHWGLAIGDVDGDGNDDVVVGGAGGLAVLKARQRDSLAGLALESLGTSIRGHVPMQVVDLDGDGRRDVLTADEGLSVAYRTETGWRTSTAQIRSRVVGARIVQLAETPTLVAAVIAEGHIDAVVVRDPRIEALGLPPDAEALTDAPFLANASIR